MFFLEYWYFTLALIAAVILTVFMMSKAGKAVRLNRLEKEKIIARLDHEKELREEFRSVDSKTFLISDRKRLFEGIAMNIQMSIEKIADIDNAFARLSKPKRYVYALEILLSECEENSLHSFFGKYSKPLTPNAFEAADEIIGGKFAELVKHNYHAFDNENEEFSLIKTEIEKNDKSFSELLLNDKEQILNMIYKYILENKEKFINNSATSIIKEEHQ